MPEQANDLSAYALLDLPEARRFVWRNETDVQRDDILIDAINDVSEAIRDYCKREFVPTTVSDRSGSDGVGNGTTTFTSASAAFTTSDPGHTIRINNVYYTIVSRTSSTAVVLSAAVPAGTGLAWDFGEARSIVVTSGGYADLRPYDLARLEQLTLYADRADLDDEVLTSYQLEAGEVPTGTYIAIRVAAPAFSPLVEGFGSVLTVRGWWGMPVVPHAVRLAAKQWVKNIAENPGSYSSHTMNGYSINPEFDTIATAPPAGMPAAVRYRLDDYARGYTLR